MESHRATDSDVHRCPQIFCVWTLNRYLFQNSIVFQSTSSLSTGIHVLWIIRSVRLVLYVFILMSYLPVQPSTVRKHFTSVACIMVVSSQPYVRFGTAIVLQSYTLLPRCVYSLNSFVFYHIGNSIYYFYCPYYYYNRRLCHSRSIKNVVIGQ